MHFPGAEDIVAKSYWEIDPADYDLFIILDSSIDGISRLREVTLPESLKFINIDHHRSNTHVGEFSIVDPSYPATAQLLYDILNEMNVAITPEIAADLFIGIYTDTGGFKYGETKSSTFDVAAELAKIFTNFPKLIAQMENSNTIGDMAFEGAALSAIEVIDEKVILSVVPYSIVQQKNIPDVSISAGSISSIIRTMIGYDLFGALIEARPDRIKLSFRSNDPEKYDVSRLAISFGGGGHKAAAGFVLNMPLLEAKAAVVEKIKELYNL
jgi:phosphoesterase RecJ-like protein